MGRVRGIALLTALAVVLFVASASGLTAGQKRASVDPYWLGPSFEGVELNEERHITGPEFIYGECGLEPGSTACSFPAVIETSTTCDLNPIATETPGEPVSLLRRGGLVTQNRELGVVYVGTGDRTFSIKIADRSLTGPALADARRRSQIAPGPLAPPVYPIAVLRELKRVTAAAARLHGIKAIAAEAELRPVQVRYRLRIAELLGPEALVGVLAPTLSTARVRRLVELAVNLSLYPRRTAEKNGTTVAGLRRLVRPVRGLANLC